MSMLKKLIAAASVTAMLSLPTQSLDAVSYVTDTGGYAYDESRAVTNLAPAIALGTVAIVGIIAIAVQNSHGHSSSSSSSRSPSSSHAHQ
jgi:hypothetical protein